MASRYGATEAGGAGGIRTLDTPLQAYNGLANRRLQPLGHSSATRQGVVARTFRVKSRSTMPKSSSGIFWAKIPTGLVAITALAFVALAACSTQYQLPASDADAIGPFAWCADVGGDVGTTNCGYVTLEQCRAASGGIAGQCYPNPERGAAEPQAAQPR